MYFAVIVLSDEEILTWCFDIYKIMNPACDLEQQLKKKKKMFNLRWSFSKITSSC